MTGKTLISALLLLLMVTFTSDRVAANDPASARSGSERGFQYYQDALSRFNKGEFNAAIIQLKNAIQQDPRDIPSRLLLARTYLKLEMGSAAEIELLKAQRDGAHKNYILPLLARAQLFQRKYKSFLADFPITNKLGDIEPELRVIRGLAHFALQQLNRADREFSAALALDPRSWEAHLGIAKVQLTRGHNELAAVTVAKAEKIDPSQSEIWFLKGEISRSRRDFDTALRHYSRAVELFDIYIPARMRRAAILVDRGQGELAIKDIDTVLSKEPRNIQATYLRALTLAQSNDLSGARSALQDAGQLLRRLDGRDVFRHPPTLLISGIVHYFQKNYVTAREHLAQFVNLRPGHAGARKILGKLLLQKGDHKKAVEVLRPAVESTPKDAELLATYADALMKGGRHRDATEVFARAAALAPNASGLLTRLALTRLISGEGHNQVSKDLRAALKVSPDSSTANSLLIMTHLKSGNFKSAKKSAEAALIRAPGNPQLHNLLGGARAGLGDLKGAKDAFEAALKIYPGFVSALVNLGKIQIKQGQIAAAKRRLDAYLKNVGPNSDIMLLLADISLRKRDISGAVRWIEKARILTGHDLKPHLALIQLYSGDNRTKKAAEVAREVREKFPETLEVLEVSALTERALYQETYSADDRSEQAKNAAKEVENLLRRMSDIAVKQNSTSWLNKIVRYQIGQRDYEGAQRTAQETLLLDNKNVTANVSLFHLLLRKGDKGAARQHATHLTNILPNSPIGHTLLGDINMRDKRYKQAVAAYSRGLRKKQSSRTAIKLFYARKAGGLNALGFIEKWVSNHPDDRRATRILAGVYSREGRHRDAVRLYENLMKLRPNDPGLMNSLALLQGRMGNLSAALTHAEKAYKLAPNEPSIIDTFGWIQVQNGNLAYGLKLLRNAEIRAPEVPEIHFHIGVALNRQGRNNEALRYLRKSLGLSTAFEGAETARMLLKEITGG